MRNTAVVVAAAMRPSEGVATPRVVAIAAADTVIGADTVIEVGTVIAAVSAAVVTVSMARGGGEVSGWDCILRACPCTTRRIGGTEFPTTTRMTLITSGTPRSANTRL